MEPRSIDEIDIYNSNYRIFRTQLEASISAPEKWEPDEEFEQYRKMHAERKTRTITPESVHFSGGEDLKGPLLMDRKLVIPHCLCAECEEWFRVLHDQEEYLCPDCR